MKMYYPVAMAVWDDGYIVPPTLMDEDEFEEKPASKVTEISRRTLYVHWFDTRAEALEFIDARRGNPRF